MLTWTSTSLSKRTHRFGTKCLRILLAVLSKPDVMCRKISENIVKGLTLMKCPLKIQPHQIQGLDYPKIFPVVQWLVKRAFEFRAAEEGVIRRHSEAQFGKSFGRGTHEPTTSTEAAYPRRIYKHKPFARVPEEPYLVQTVLLEFGRQTLLPGPQASTCRKTAYKKG